MWQASQGRVTPREADELEIWEIAVLLGHAEELADPEEDRRQRRHSRAPDPAAARSQRAADAMARNRARLAAARGEAPEPEADPIDPGTFQQLSGALSGRPRNP